MNSQRLGNSPWFYRPSFLGFLITLAYALLIMWMQMLFKGGLFSNPSSSMLAHVQDGKLAYMAATALIALVILPSFLSPINLKRDFRVLAISGILMVLGPLVCLIPLTESVQSFPYVSLGLAIAGAGAALIIPLLGKLFYTVGPKATTISILFSYFVSTLLREIAWIAPAFLRAGIIICLPITACLILRAIFTAEQSDEHGNQRKLEGSVQPQWRALDFRIPVPIALLGAVLISGFLGSFVRGAMYYSGFAYAAIASDSGLLRAAFFAAMILLLAVFGRGYDTFSIFWPWAAIPVVIASVALPFVADYNPIIISTFFMAIQNLCSTFNYTIFTDIAIRYDKNPGVIFCWGRVADAAGCLLGFFLGSILASSIIVSEHLWYILSTISAFSIVSLIVLVVLNRHLIDLNFSAEVSHEDTPQSGFQFEVLKARYSFTVREIEIISLLNDGRSVPFIAQELLISTSTVRTHVQNIYRKLDVHNRQEFLDVIRG